ncbi:transaldolase family protein [uncultured Pseudomonas sp.]|uniref:transaldolase family protein n=1 Tax=uncultured Pseudomonas sp. TaxID=114707 RepID=UPI0025DBBE6E|nr:transaldolase family protein [uncultured Pseudomonas sp.]
MRMLDNYPSSQECIETLAPLDSASAEVGIAGALTSIASITASIVANAQHWSRRARQWNRLVSPAPVHRTLYEAAVREGAEMLFKAWQRSHAQQGWMVVEVEPSEMYSPAALFRRARELSNLMPNVMTSIPLSVAGCEVIEELVATGHAVNASLCFSVAQLQAALEAIRRGRQRALGNGVCLAWTSHLLSAAPGDVLRHPECAIQAEQAGVNLSDTDRAWASVAVCQALRQAMRSHEASARLVVSGFDECCHTERSGCRLIIDEHDSTTLHSVGAEQLERLIVGGCGRPSGALSACAQVPEEVLQRLRRVRVFRQLCGAEPLASACFARHPVFLHSLGQSLRAQTQLMRFARQLQPPLYADIPAAR